MTTTPILTLTRRAEFDALPVGSVVLDPDDAVWKKHGPSEWLSTEWVDPHDLPRFAPCRVLYTPEVIDGE